MTTDWADEFEDDETAPDPPRTIRLWLRSWAALGLVWTVFIGALGVLAAVLQVLGPPQPAASSPTAETSTLSSPASPSLPSAPPSDAALAPKARPDTAMAAAHPVIAPPAPVAEPVLPPVAVILPSDLPAVRPPGSVAPPDPNLLQPSKLYPGAQLPRIGPDRMLPLKAYAARFNMNDPHPRVAILMAGIGMNEAESLAAIDALPPQVSLAVSPYSFRPNAVLTAARNAGHEYLVSLPMEPIGYPLNDPGDHALLTGASEATNALRLDWALTRITGYVGATGALGELRGERFGAAIDQMAPVLDRLADLGLLYVDPRPNGEHLSGVPAQRGIGRAVDVVLDDPPGRDSVDRKLAMLEQMARDHGGAIGLAGRPSPITIGRIAAWSTTLPARGLALAPVSVVVQMPKPIAPNSTIAVRTNLFK